MGELATRLARAGMVVFAPTYRSDLTTPDGLSQAGSDIGCGYQFARTTASQHGGDLTQPVTAPGKPIHWFDDVFGWGNKGADIYLLAGDQDTRCPAWQSRQLARALRDAGYHVDLIQLTGADHYAPIFHEVRNGQFQVVTYDAAGQRAVQVVLDAIATRQHTSSGQ
jgi:acetyl esterase/lipase